MCCQLINRSCKVVFFTLIFLLFNVTTVHGMEYLKWGASWIVGSYGKKVAEKDTLIKNVPTIVKNHPIKLGLGVALAICVVKLILRNSEIKAKEDEIRTTGRVITRMRTTTDAHRRFLSRKRNVLKGWGTLKLGVGKNNYREVLDTGKAFCDSMDNEINRVMEPRERQAGGSSSNHIIEIGGNIARAWRNESEMKLNMSRSLVMKNK